MTVAFTPFDPIDGLDSIEAVLIYELEAQATGDIAYIVHAMTIAQRARYRLAAMANLNLNPSPASPQTAPTASPVPPRSAGPAS